MMALGRERGRAPEMGRGSLSDEAAKALAEAMIALAFSNA